ncbi:hypothetical protein CB1_001108006 [Camelus ferus]|nr:hypothetical protein CB1_001108006 [Camelus ferus]
MSTVQPPLAGSEQEMSRQVEHCLFKREGSCVAEDDAADIQHENCNRSEEYEWCGQKRIRATTVLEGGFRGSGFVMCGGKENPDSDAALDVDGDDTPEYAKPQYTEADVIPCPGEEPGEAKEREALRGAVLNGGLPSTRITPEFSKWASDEMPSTSNERFQTGIAQQWIQSKREDIVSQMTEACLNQSLDALLSRDLIMKEDYELISTKPTRTSKVRQLLDTSDIQGEEFAKVIVQKLKDNKQMGLQPYPEILVVSQLSSLNLFQNKSL